jgi:adenosylcobinamide-GDP ribazoletransferase
MRGLIGALQFLTVLPVRGQPTLPGEAAVFFPIAGAILGASAGAVMLAATALAGRPLGALLAVAWLIGITGGLHEDGLADVTDAVRAGRSREKIMQVLKDSRIGAYGAIALIVSILMRWQSLAQMNVNPIPGLTSALALSRASLVGLAGCAQPAGTGLGRTFAASCRRFEVTAVFLESAAITALMGPFVGWGYAASMLGSSVGIVWLARWYFTQRLGGVNGDCLGATCHVLETVNMVIMACHTSI